MSSHKVEVQGAVYAFGPFSAEERWAAYADIVGGLSSEPKLEEALAAFVRLSRLARRTDGAAADKEIDLETRIKLGVHVAAILIPDPWKEATDRARPIYDDLKRKFEEIFGLKARPWWP